MRSSSTTATWRWANISANTTFNFAKHRRPEHYKLITERTGVEGRARELRNFHAICRFRHRRSRALQDPCRLRAAAAHRLGDDGGTDPARSMPRPSASSTSSPRTRRSACSPSTSGRDGRLKDTWLNIQRTGEFVVNLTDEPLARAMHDSSGDFPPDIGEPDYLGLKLGPSVDIKVPRLADCALGDGVQDLAGDQRQGRPPAGDRRGPALPYPRRAVGSRGDAASGWRTIIPWAACSPTAIAAPTTASCFRPRKGRRRRSPEAELRNARP